jgi:hypothetical protein
MNLNSKVELLIRNLFVISFKVEDGSFIIKYFNRSLCIGFQWKYLGLSITFSHDTSFYFFGGCILSSIPYKGRDHILPHCLMDFLFIGWYVLVYFP